MIPAFVAKMGPVCSAPMDHATTGMTLSITMEAQNAYYEKYLNELQNKVATYLLFWDSSTTNSLSLDLHLRIFEAFRDRDEQKGVLALMEDLQLAEECVRESQQL